MTPFQKFIVKAYRMLAMGVLTCVLLAAASYFCLVLLYGLNSSWGAPVILTKSSPRILAMSAESFRARQGLDTVVGQVELRKGEIQGLEVQKASLEDLVKRYEGALQSQKRLDSGLSGSLSQLARDKRAVDNKTAEVVAANRKTEAAIERELAAGVITAETASRMRGQMVATEASLSAGRIGTASLEHQMSELTSGIATLDGGAASPKALENLARLAALKNELSDVTLKLEQARRELTVKQGEVESLTAFLNTLKNSPYFRVAQGGQSVNEFAFVPYDNAASAVVGAPVYSCLLEVVFCRKVGTIKGVTGDEEKGRHPIFQRDLRGTLVELDLTNAAAAKNRVLFFGSAPLFL